MEACIHGVFQELKHNPWLAATSRQEIAASSITGYNGIPAAALQAALNENAPSGRSAPSTPSAFLLQR